MTAEILQNDTKMTIGQGERYEMALDQKLKFVVVGLPKGDGFMWGIKNILTDDIEVFGTTNMDEMITLKKSTVIIGG